MRNIEILAYISQNPGCSSRNVANFFNIGLNHASASIGNLKKSGRVRVDYSRYDGRWRYLVTNWGKKYLNDQWNRYMGERLISDYYDTAVSGLKIRERQDAPSYDEEGKLFYRASLKKRDYDKGLVFVERFNLYDNASWKDVASWILSNYGPGMYLVEYGGKYQKIDLTGKE